MPSVQEDEEQATDKAWPDLQAHVNYLSDVYTFAFKIQQTIDGKRIADISDVVRAQLMILMRITDFLRCIQLLAVKCYPEQAGTLAASIFELTHTAVLFSRSPMEATQWLAANSIKQQVPRKLFGNNWKELVKANCEYFGGAERSGAEYQVYEQLCWMKHSLPKMQDMRVEKDSVFLIFGPHTDERALSHAWFAMEHAGRLTEFVAALLMDEQGTEETRVALAMLAAKNVELRNLAIARFGQENPFNEPASTTP
jgi:hypothetical protein